MISPREHDVYVLDELQQGQRVRRDDALDVRAVDQHLDLSGGWSHTIAPSRMHGDLVR